MFVMILSNMYFVLSKLLAIYEVREQEQVFCEIKWWTPKPHQPLHTQGKIIKMRHSASQGEKYNPFCIALKIAGREAASIFCP